MLKVYITPYYGALNELAAMLQDGEITQQDWVVQRNLMHYTWHDAALGGIQ